MLAKRVGRVDHSLRQIFLESQLHPQGLPGPHGPGLLALHVPDRSSYREHCFDLMTGREEHAAQVAEDNILTSYHGVAESGGGKCARIG